MLILKQFSTYSTATFLKSIEIHSKNYWNTRFIFAEFCFVILLWQFSTYFTATFLKSIEISPKNYWNTKFIFAECCFFNFLNFFSEKYRALFDIFLLNVFFLISRTFFLRCTEHFSTYCKQIRWHLYENF